jgi:hypothetical protein
MNKKQHRLMLVLALVAAFHVPTDHRNDKSMCSDTPL